MAKLDFSSLPETAFVDPKGDNRQAIEALFRQVTTQILDYLTAAAHHTPLPQAKGLQQIEIPETGTDLADVLEQVDAALKLAMNPAHPRYLGHMDPMPTTLSIVGDWVVAALNNNMLSVEMSPLFSRLEPQLMRAIAIVFGLGDRAGAFWSVGEVWRTFRRWQWPGT